MHFGLILMFVSYLHSIQSFSPKNFLWRGKYNRSIKRVMSSSQTYENFRFEIKKQDQTTKARTSVIHTPHGLVHCPNFVFCGTKAAMKGITVDQLREEGSQIMLSNTYHLMLQPGPDVVAKMGGLQKMTQWNGPMLTDSGGYQIFSMGHGSISQEIKGNRGNITGKGQWTPSLVKIDEEGATFRSYVDGAIHELTPEKAIAIQQKLGADLIVVLDECTPYHVDRSYTEDSMHRSHRWALRSLQEFNRLGCNGTQALYGIVQGGVYDDLRAVSCEFVNSTPFFGMAIGGCLGATRQKMHSLVSTIRGQLRNDRPVHLLGIGGIRDIFHGVRQGIDTFDCVHPTRLARHGGGLVPASVWDESPNLDINDHREELKRRNLVKHYFRINGMPKPPDLHKIELTPAMVANITAINNSKSRATSIKNASRTVVGDVLRAIGMKDTTDSGSKPGENDDQSNSISKSDMEINKDNNIIDIPNENSGIINKNSNNDNTTIGGNQSRSKQKAGVNRIKENINIKNSSFRTDPRPIDPSCQCYTCRKYSRAYLHHLFSADESLGSTLMTIHNVHFMNRMMKRIREGIETGTLDEVEKEFIHPDLTSDESASAIE